MSDESFACIPHLLSDKCVEVGFLETVLAQIEQSEEELTKGVFFRLRLAISKFLRRIYWSSFWQRNGSSELENIVGELLRECPSDFIHRPGGIVAGKNIPSMVDTFRATFARLSVLEEIRANTESFKGIILGGSLSYGAFHSVRDKGRDGEGDSSDIDLILVAPEMTEGLVAGLRNTSFFFSDDVEVFQNRFQNFRSLWRQGQADIVSQKISVKSGGYDVSFHIFPLVALERITGREFRKNLRRKNFVLYLRDYKLLPFSGSHVESRNFCGERYQIQINSLGNSPVKDGVVMQMPAYAIADGKYYPSIWQNLISPEFQVISDTDGAISRLVENCRETMEWRIKKEGLKDVSCRDAHIRAPIFMLH